jgi:vacuolar-type H+-ATPase subunit E/Vma4
MPEGKTEIVLLNALLEERDQVLDERNRIIQKVETEKQARIDELKNDKEELTKMLNSVLGRIHSDQQIALAYQKAWVDYEAEKAAKGDQKRKKEIMYKMNKLVDGILQGDALKDIPDGTGKTSMQE